ncbi:hypothetical protein DOY81_007972 [Sarcophaga bullata]|nr:hypothetical protein DOY81_007972 [Sarcophaga bullata]
MFYCITRVDAYVKNDKLRIRRQTKLTTKSQYSQYSTENK